MLNFQALLKNTFLINNNNFIHGISFIVISLIAIHMAIFFNFYKFSNDWIVSESEKTTFILSKNINEKVIPEIVTSKIINYLEENQELIKFKILELETPHILHLSVIVLNDHLNFLNYFLYFP